MKKLTKKEIEFLKENNAIEGVYDGLSLQQAAFAWQYLCKQKEMTPDVILGTHKILMLHQTLLPNEKGYFRNIPVYIGSKEAMKKECISEEIKIWCELVNSFPKEWKKHHIQYENVHPFVDGNGRTGRMLMNWERLKAGLPILIINAEERGKYYEWFRKKHE